MNRVIEAALRQLALTELKDTFALPDNATVDDVFCECFRRTHSTDALRKNRPTVLEDAKEYLRGNLPEYVLGFVKKTALISALS